jgi:amino-acid N-acetyltransferase
MRCRTIAVRQSVYLRDQMTEQPFILPTECILRRACAQDIWAIRKLVLSAKLDPTQVRWAQFWVIECEGGVVACGQLRRFALAQELGSLVVASAWRGRGLGSFLVKHLIQEATEPLYLECLGSRLAKFYTRFGFEAIAWQELPPSLQWKFGMSQVASKLLPMISVTLMQYQGLGE